MRLDHVAVWTRDIERLRAFYERYFGASSGPRYESATRQGFTSYFLTFPTGGTRLEIIVAPTNPAAAAARAAATTNHDLDPWRER